MKILFTRVFLLIIICLDANNAISAPGCVGRITNPITDVCWKCLFPIHVAGLKVVSSSMPASNSSAKMPVCFCKRRGNPVPMPGIPISFWEPVRLVDVTKAPLCMVSLGGISLGQKAARGFKDDQDGSSFYHVHWYIYPVIFWLELLTDFLCLDMLPVDVAYLSEFDPLWNDDVKSTILNPEAAMFGSIAAHGACLADCTAASAGLPIDSLFWCAGCQGSLYPFTGNISGQNGGVQGSLLLVSRMIFKLHREFLLWSTWGPKMLTDKCSKYPLPLLKEKSAYRLQMTFPVPETKNCKRIGQSELTWQAGREFPVKGEDFGYLIWKKRECCLGAL